MANLNGFDATQVPEGDQMGAVPEGQYVAVATASEFKPTKSGNGQYLQFVFDVIDGQYKGRKLWARLNLQNPNQMAREIAERELAQLCKAVGIVRPQDSAELHNKPVLLTVKVELDERKREGNVIKKYEPIKAPGGGMMAAQVNQQQPAQQQPAQQQPAYQQQQSFQQQQPAAGGKKPWEQ